MRPLRPAAAPALLDSGETPISLFGRPKSATRTPPQPALVLRVQSAVQGLARPLVYGLARLAGNVIGFWNFTATAVQENTQGGKGGGGGGAVTTGYNYSCALAVGLAEGPIAAVLQGWSNKAPESVAQLGFSIFAGGYEQLAWGWLIANQPGYAQNFRGLAYVANPSLALGSSPTLPNFSFEVLGVIAGAVTETAVIPGSPYQVTAAAYDVAGSAVAEELLVPQATPYTLQAVNIGFDASGGGLSVRDATVALTGTYGALPGSAWSGVYYTDTLTFLAKVGSAPAAGQYTVTASGLYTFNAADAGAAVTIVDLALSPGVNFSTSFTGAVSAGSATVTALSSVAGIAVGDVVLGAVLPAGAMVSTVSGGAATCTVSSGSAIVGVNSGTFAATAGAVLAGETAGLFPAGTSVTGPGGPTALISAAAAGSGLETLNFTVTQTGTWNGDATATLGSVAGVTVGATVATLSGGLGGFEGRAVVTDIVGLVVTIYTGEFIGLVGDDTFYFTTTLNGRLHGTTQITDLSGSVVAGAAVTDQLGFIAAGTMVASSTGTSLVLSATASGSSGSDVLTFPSELILSKPAHADGTGVSLAAIGDALQQVAPASGGPGTGQFTVTPAGVFAFNAADTGKTVLITDVPDANPADVIADLLTNPQYGVALWPADRLDDLATYRTYAQAAGLFVSPVLKDPVQLTSFLRDLLQATNSEAVWTDRLRIVPYGDAALTANGASYAPPTQPLYDLDDGDFVPNQATNAASTAGSGGGDPVALTRLDPADQVNDVQVEYLDRANSYNPAVAEAQDDAAINAYGVRPSGTRALHMLCDRRSAMASAQLQLGRAQVRNTYAFTLGPRFIGLDPLDIVALSDARLGLLSQWVRITEITENDDGSLSMIAEEYLAGTGAAPKYGHQGGAGFAPNFNRDPGNVG